jgi:hypothetical protein
MVHGEMTGFNRQEPRSGRGNRNCNRQGRAGRGANRGLGRCSRQGARQGQDCRDVSGNASLENSWIEARLNRLQAIIEKLSARLGKDA